MRSRWRYQDEEPAVHCSSPHGDGFSILPCSGSGGGGVGGGGDGDDGTMCGPVSLFDCRSYRTFVRRRCIGKLESCSHGRRLSVAILTAPRRCYSTESWRRRNPRARQRQERAGMLIQNAHASGTSAAAVRARRSLLLSVETAQTIERRMEVE
jgi:hypothetical protein